MITPPTWRLMPAQLFPFSYLSLRLLALLRQRLANCFFLYEADMLTAEKTISANSLTSSQSTHSKSVRAMANDILDINALHGAVQASDLIAAGYTTAEIIEFQAEATALANRTHVRYQYPSRHGLSEMSFKISKAVIEEPAQPDNHALNDDQRKAWQAYCRTRAAYAQDPWHVLRHRCINLLLAYLLTLPVVPGNRNKLIEALDAKLAPAETIQ
ncbi:hypothetical protein HBA92_21885 [Ochrobactrum sp. MR28]|nr:hypothetical protein [Ochrobactrum sp. MR28]MBX8818985.1 hypothetical protein [Ochrobactrum sp. MR31]